MRLPVQMQRAMAAEAESAREARAKVMFDIQLILPHCFNSKPNNKLQPGPN